MHLRARVLVVVLLFGLVAKFLELVFLLLKVRLRLEPLLVLCVDDLTLARHSSTLFDGRALVDSLPPLLEVRETAEVDTGKVCDVHPAKVGDIGDAVLVADEVFVLGELLVKDAVQTLGLSDVALFRRQHRKSKDTDT